MLFLILLLLPCLLAVTLKIYLKLTTGRCKSNVCLVRKTALITGGNSGLGYQVALALAGRGCRVIIADKDNCDNTKQEIIEATGNTNIVTKQFNLSSLTSVRKLAKDLNDSEKRLDILINIAGTFGQGSSRTEDGLNIQMQVNHFGSFLLTHLLVELLKKSAPSRIIFVSSLTAYYCKMALSDLNNFEAQPGSLLDANRLYLNSKLCNVITANEFSKKLKGFGVASNSLHPGVVFTPVTRTFYERVENYSLFNKIFEWVMSLAVEYFCKSPEEGAQTILHVALAKELEEVTGKFFAECHECQMPEMAKSELFSKQIWNASEDFVKLRPEERLGA